MKYKPFIKKDASLPYLAVMLAASLLTVLLCGVTIRIITMPVYEFFLLTLAAAIATSVFVGKMIEKIKVTELGGVDMKHIDTAPELDASFCSGYYSRHSEKPSLGWVEQLGYAQPINLKDAEQDAKANMEKELEENNER